MVVLRSLLEWERVRRNAVSHVHEVHGTMSIYITRSSRNPIIYQYIRVAIP